MCPVAADGVAFTYDIRVRGEMYSFDSCVDDIADERLFIELEKYFRVFNSVHRNER